mmetsp:Transcript_15710/g.23711  ORF Transcript_15710/g.23711 Transcript_15710/m.23711 type:complete len:87 (-) Transcript_15710:21-281(-)
MSKLFSSWLRILGRDKAVNQMMIVMQRQRKLVLCTWPKHPKDSHFGHESVLLWLLSRSSTILPPVKLKRDPRCDVDWSNVDVANKL